MSIHDPRSLRKAAAELLQRSPNQMQLVLLWAGASAGLSLLTGLLSWLLDTGIAETGGLSGMELRSMLSTAQSVLQLVTTLALPFWTLGYQHTVLRTARGQSCSPRTLLEGFRRFGPGLRLMVLEGLLLSLVSMAAVYLGCTVLSFTPLAQPVLQVMEPMLAAVMEDPNWLPSDAEMALLAEAMLPMLLVSLVLCLAVLIPVSYRLRLAQLRLMDDPRCGARQALRTSAALTKGSCMALFRIDLGFWWFYLLQGIILAVSYGDMLLPLVGVSLPISADLAFWGFYAVALALQVAVYALFHNRVSVTYALAYDSLLPKN